MKKVFEVHLCFLRINQSETALKQVFTSLRTFIYKVWRTGLTSKSIICYVLRCAPVLISSSCVSSSSFRAHFLKAVPTCVLLSATKSWNVVTPSWAPFAAMRPIFSTSSWRATLTTQGASHLSAHTYRWESPAVSRQCFSSFNPDILDLAFFSLHKHAVFYSIPLSFRWWSLSVSW